MLKKFILWTLYAAFVGMIILAAINRTMVKIWDNDSVLSTNVNAQNDNVAPQLGAAVVGENKEHENQDTTEYEWVTLVGTVSSILPRGMIVADADGQLIEVVRRSWRFAQEQGFAPQIGDQVTLDGFYEHGEFEVACLTDLNNGQSVCLRDETGQPLWGSDDHE